MNIIKIFYKKKFCLVPAEQRPVVGHNEQTLVPPCRHVATAVCAAERATSWSCGEENWTQFNEI
jgi:hypothetical protein